MKEDLTVNPEVENADSFVYPEEIIAIEDLTLESLEKKVSTKENVTQSTENLLTPQTSEETKFNTPDIKEEIAFTDVNVEQSLVPEVETSVEEKTESAVSETSSVEFKLPENGLSKTNLLTKPEEEIKDRAVPRFTKQPSEEWAPQQAYEVLTIPGMRSFEEEMGDYQNDKSFLYQDALDFALDPDEDSDSHDQELQVTEQIAMADLPVVNPFSSFLSQEDAHKVEEITNYSLEKEEKKVEENKAQEEKPVILLSATVEESTSIEEVSKTESQNQVEKVIQKSDLESKVTESTQIAQIATQNEEVVQDSDLESKVTESTQITQLATQNEEVIQDSDLESKVTESTQIAQLTTQNEEKKSSIVNMIKAVDEGKKIANEEESKTVNKSVESKTAENTTKDKALTKESTSIEEVNKTVSQNQVEEVVQESDLENKVTESTQITQLTTQNEENVKSQNHVVESEVKNSKAKTITLISLLTGLVAGAVLAFSASKKSKKKAKNRKRSVR